MAERPPAGSLEEVNSWEKETTPGRSVQTEQLTVSTQGTLWLLQYTVDG